MKRIDKTKVKTMIDVVREYEQAHQSMPIPSWSQIRFYNNAFWESIKLIEEITGETLC